MRTRHKVLLVVEVVICLAPITLLWALGAFFVPLALASALFSPLEPTSWIGSAVMLWFVGCGLCGLVTLVRLLDRLLGSRKPIARPWLVLAGLTVGILPILPFLLVAKNLSTLAVVAPIAATAHVLYLSRRLLFPRSAREGLLS